MGIFKAIDISASGLTAQSLRMDVIAQNVANANTTRTDDGGPYQRQTTLLRQQSASFADTLEQARSGLGPPAAGVEIAATLADETPFTAVYDPAHPDAGEDGYVQMPNVDVAREYVDMISATRSYEANITVISASRHMAQKALEIGR